MSDRAHATRVLKAVAASPAFTRDQAAKMANRAVQDAQHLAVDVRQEDPRLVWGELTLWLRDEPHRVTALTVALAAMVPIEQQSAQALLAWTFPLAEAGVA
jgi:hypothetical protein